MEPTTLTLNQIEQLLLRTESGRELIAARQRQDERVRLAKEIAALREEEARELPPLKHAQEQAWRAVLEAHKNYKDLEAKARGQESAYAATAARLAHWISRNEGALRRSASPMIDEFITRCRRAMAEVRNTFQSLTLPPDMRGLESGKPIMQTTSNAADIELAVAALEAAIQEAESLQLLALSDDEVATRLQQLAATLPANTEPYVLAPDHPHELSLMIREQSELLHLSEPGATVRRGLRQTLGLGALRPLRR